MRVGMHHLLKVANQLEQTTIAKEKRMGKLASGYRVNRAADDAASLSISEKMRGQIRGLLQAADNIADAQSLLHTGESVFDGATAILQRMRELTVQSLNDTNTLADRRLLNEELKALKHSMDRLSSQAEWSGKPVIEQHEAVYSSFEGNRVFPEGHPVMIYEGLNDTLDITVSQQTYSFKIPPGEYEPIETLIDELDSALMKVDAGLILHVTPNRTISLQAEHHANIDYIKGGASFLFYQYQLGQPPGMIIGTTKFEEDGVIHVVRGRNDTLSFLVGSDEQYDFNFPPKPSGYTQDEFIQILNEEFARRGHGEDVRAVKYGDGNIALASNKYVITGIGGNMMEIDGITSPLYDNRKSGFIRKSNAQITGRNVLPKEMTFTKENGTFSIFSNGELVQIDFLKGQQQRTLTREQVIDEINSQLQLEGSTITASLFNHRLHLVNDRYGNGSSIHLLENEPTFKMLLMEKVVEEETQTVTTGKLSYAEASGYKAFPKNTVIPTHANELKLTVDGKAYTFQVPTGKVSGEEIIKALNEQAQKQAIPISYRLSEGRVVIRHQEVGKGYFKVDTQSTAYKVLFEGEERVQPAIVRGTTKITPPPEGIVRPPTYKETPAQVISAGRIEDIDLTTIASIDIQVNGKTETVSIHPKKYSDVDEFITFNQDYFQMKGLHLKSVGGKLLVETVEVGEHTSIEFLDVDDEVYQKLLTDVQIKLPTQVAGGGDASPSEIKSFQQLAFPIDQAMDLTFQLSEGNLQYDIKLTIDQLPIENASQLQKIWDEQLKAFFRTVDQDGTISIPDPLPVLVKVEDNGNLAIQTSTVGPSAKLLHFGGTLFDTLFKRQVEKWYAPSARSVGKTMHSPTFLVGREDLSTKKIEIHPRINDVLQLDLSVDGQTFTLQFLLEPGLHTGMTIQNMINRQMETQLQQHGLRKDLVRAQIGAPPTGSPALDEASKGSLSFVIQTKEDGMQEDHTYVMERLRGSAAYSLFYRSYGDPAPSMVVGVRDLSGGITIETSKNDTLIFDLNHVEKKIVIPPGTYSSDELLEVLNDEFLNQQAHVVASYVEGKLKMSTTETGQIPLDGLRGNARDDLFFYTERRANDRSLIFHTGANRGDHLMFDKMRMSARLLRVNTIMIDEPSRSEKALSRIDKALQMLSSERGRIGATVNRLEHARSIVALTSENLMRSESKIRDADIAKEQLALAKATILEQAAQMSLVHSFQSSERVLELIRV